MHTSGIVVLVLSMLGACLCGCTGGHDARYTLVYLKTGPNSASHTPEQKQEIFKGHMANMQRLAKEKTLIIAGPLVQPRDKAWRGLFVFDVASVDEATRIAASDPGVESGEFVTDIRAARGSASLRESLRLEDELQARLKAEGQTERKEGEPPPSLRGYVIVHAEDVAKAAAALRAASAAAPGSTPKPPAIIWSLQFQGVAAGVMVVDATSVQEVRETLARLNTGAVECDGWFSTRALEGLAGLRERG